MNKIIYVLIFLAVLIVGGIFYTLYSNKADYEAEPTTEPDITVTETVTPEPIEEIESVEVEEARGAEEVIGESVNGTDIMAYHFGEGEEEVLFVGGIHGGYSWNTALVAYELIEYLDENPDAVPENLMVTVIPALNPDGLSEVTGTIGAFTASDVDASETERIAARFNANDVDLNRNFDCEWESTGTWQTRSVSGGDEAFSEPESKAVRDYVTKYDVVGAVAFYSAAGGVYASQCNNGTLPATTELTAVYATAAGYKAFAEFDFYEITGDMVNWLARQNIPAISVLLTDHSSTEWSKNQAGVEAVLEYFAE